MVFDFDLFSEVRRLVRLQAARQSAIFKIPHSSPIFFSGGRTGARVELPDAI
jgi:hypothetical protein